MSDRSPHGSRWVLFFENIRQALGVIAAHRLRSGLLILGVAIGVTAILAVVTILLGLGRQIEKDMAGADRPFLMASRFDVMTEGPDVEKNRARRRPDPAPAAAVRRTCDPISWIAYR